MQRFAAHTASGREIWYLHPERTEIDPADIRTALARQCRYAGAVEWTVLQHLALCTWLAERAYHDPLTTAYVAAHDLHKAYLPDLPAPLVGMLAFPTDPGEALDLDLRGESTVSAVGWRDVEARWAARVHPAVGLPFPVPAEVDARVRAVDLRALVVEATVAPGSESLRLVLERDFGGPINSFERWLATRVAAMRQPALWNVVWAAVTEGRRAAA